MIDTTNTSVNTGRNEKQKAIPSVGELDLRDYFAAKAMQALISKDGIYSEQSKAGNGKQRDFGWFFDSCARVSYDMADVMLRVRESK